jgi:predicted PolB exonuclease-like 3'-5' exonuclease
MLKKFHEPVWAFDAEWIPDPRAGRILYGMEAGTSDAEVMTEMWNRGGANEKDPTPYLKTVMCRVVSISVVTHRVNQQGEVFLQLFSLPKKIDDPESTSEKTIVHTFLEALGKWHPTLVGYNSLASDMRILVQRGIIHDTPMVEFCRRPEKPWSGPDYFTRGNDWNVDLKDVVTPGWGQGSPSLHEMATLCGIPGKMGVTGNEVPQLWLEGKLDKIVAYNEWDALTTYLLWLRIAHFAGRITGETYVAAQEKLRTLLQDEAKGAGKVHLLEYLAEWERLRRYFEESGA